MERSAVNSDKGSKVDSAKDSASRIKPVGENDRKMELDPLRGLVKGSACGSSLESVAQRMTALPGAQRREAALSLQRSRGNRFVQGMAEQAKREPNRTGMPDRLKAGIESLSGIDMSDVRVHANSPKPAQLNALAYAQGNQIHLGPGQERHLPHEAWHVVQQKQGRVRATMQMSGVGLNEDIELEGEADRIGIRAELFHQASKTYFTSSSCAVSDANLTPNRTVQRETRGVRKKSSPIEEAEELKYVERLGPGGPSGRDALKQSVLDNLGNKLRKVVPETPHIATSLTGGNAYIALNYNSSTEEQYVKHKDATKNYEKKLTALRNVYTTAMTAEHDKAANVSIEPWIGRYLHVSPIILPNAEYMENCSNPGVKCPKQHAEQFITKSITDKPPVWRHPKEEAAFAQNQGGYRVVRIGGTLLDCARCHADHHGNMLDTYEEAKKLSASTKKEKRPKKAIGINSQTGSPLFQPGAGGTDKILMDRFGRIIRSSGMHPSSDGAKRQHDTTEWARPTVKQDTPFRAYLFTKNPESGEKSAAAATQEQQRGGWMLSSVLADPSSIPAPGMNAPTAVDLMPENPPATDVPMLDSDALAEKETDLLDVPTPGPKRKRILLDVPMPRPKRKRILLDVPMLDSEKKTDLF